MTAARCPIVSDILVPFALGLSNIVLMRLSALFRSKNVRMSSQVCTVESMTQAPTLVLAIFVCRGYLRSPVYPNNQFEQRSKQDSYHSHQVSSATPCSQADCNHGFLWQAWPGHLSSPAAFAGPIPGMVFVSAWKNTWRDVCQLYVHSSWRDAR